MTRDETTVPWPTEGLSYGGDYSPEQWSWDVVHEDMELMRRAGVNLVTLGVFSWVVHEPRDGEFDFTWLDRMLDLLHENGIRVDMATPTAAVPMWLHEAHPEMLPQDIHGHPLAPGGRLGWCASSSVFRSYALRIVERLAEHVAGHPAVRLWHVSNELGGGNARCHCPVSNARFREWVAEKYGDVAALNDAWGMAFWGNSYSSFAEVTTPWGITAHNPGQLLDYERFSSDELLAHYRAEKEVLRRVTPEVPITTNFMVGIGTDVVDYTRWADEMDIVANDHYTVGPDPLKHQDIAFSGDRMRGMSKGAPWMLMEHATGAGSWHPVNQPKTPDEIVRHALAHVARGSDSVMFFQWRASISGTEQFHSAMVPHAGADSVVYRTIVDLGAKLNALAEVRGSRVEPARVALLHDNEAGWALRSGLKPQNPQRYADTARALHNALFQRAITVDVVAPWADLDDYTLVVVPGLFLLSDENARSIEAFVEGGGTVIVTWFSGIVDENNTVRPGGYPGILRSVVGTSSEEFFPLDAEQSVALTNGWTGRRWMERVRPADPALGTESIADYADGGYRGGPAIMRRRLGDGVAWYLSTDLDAPSLDELVGRVVAESGVSPAADVAPGVEAVRRTSAEATYLFLINHADEPGWADVSGVDLLTGQEHDQRVVLEPGAVAVIRERPEKRP
ncbi:beta-galactosidase [Microbacterium testaceum]|uniref:beta-galactosidase n=1 Tax=Microbacterium testaceum TaxID=2033 RepID=UPI000733D0BE|nr:beta-galactosidase [Microbacterium testaceum]KTS60116.1 beta-galactosidase [Microbacterium testaceum]